MSVSFAADTASEVLWVKNQQSVDGTEWTGEIGADFGEGNFYGIDLMPGLWIDCSEAQFFDDIEVQEGVHEHQIQFCVHASGATYPNGVYPPLDCNRAYFSGSGLSPGYQCHFPKHSFIASVDIHVEPSLFTQLFPIFSEAPSALGQFVQTEDWKVSRFPRVTPAMQAVVRQIMQVPVVGAMRRVYLQAKALELMTLILDPILRDQDVLDQANRAEALPLKPKTVEKLHHAREILRNSLDDPPSLLALAQQVGMSDRTLRRGFQELFGTTVLSYLTQRRMERAEQLLRETSLTVAEVANQVGYAHLGQTLKGDNMARPLAA
ncbi:MAG: helix-turn-helix transcriptional regulator [Leptolyngbyaceae cyanobacterium SM2_5_2]|nr:helix-turn-helix transcriptional regulator [Leptolyngbyaceae cyanobacterium SM2_5_2]